MYSRGEQVAISVDWPSQIVTVNQTDTELTHVSGTFYTADSNAIRLAVKDLEDNTEGMPWPRVTNHNTEVGPIAGVTFVRSIEIINGYQIQFLPDTQWTVVIEGSNNNYHDVAAGVLVQNQVQVIPSNTAGYIVVETGTSGLTTPESQALIDIASDVDGLVIDVFDLDTKVDLLLTAQDLTLAQMVAEHTTDPVDGKLILRNTVTLQRWEADAWQDADQTIPYSGDGMESVGQLAAVAWS